MIKSPFKKKNRYEDFWDWFVKNSDDYYYHLENKLDTLFDQLGKQLCKINVNLVFEFSRQKENGKREFIISADGILDSFPDVIQLVDNAPSLEKWDIIAFRPRQGTDTFLQFDNGMELRVDDVFFDYEIMEDGKIGIVLYIKDFNKYGDDITGAIYVLLDSILGEYDVETKIGYIVRVDLNEKNDQSRPLKELPTIVDNHFLIN